MSYTKPSINSVCACGVHVVASEAIGGPQSVKVKYSESRKYKPSHCCVEEMAPGPRTRTRFIVCFLLAVSAAVVFFWPMDPGIREFVQLLWAIGFMAGVIWLRRSIKKGARKVPKAGGLLKPSKHKPWCSAGRPLATEGGPVVPGCTCDVGDVPFKGSGRLVADRGPLRMTRESVRAVGASLRVLSMVPQEGLSPRQVAALAIPVHTRLWYLVCACGLPREGLEAFARRCAARTLEPASSPIVSQYLATGNPALLAVALADARQAAGMFPCQLLAIEIVYQMMPAARVMQLVGMVIRHAERMHEPPVAQILMDDLLEIMEAPCPII